MADINDKFVIYYAVRGYASGETVTIDIYDTVGTKEIDSQNMTEIGTLGIYSFNWFPKKRTTYLAVTDCPAKPRQQHQVFRIEKTKLAGAVSIPSLRFPFKTEDKDNLFKKLDDIFRQQIKFAPTLPKIPDHSKSLKRISEDIKDTNRKVAVLSLKVEKTDPRLDMLQKIKDEFIVVKKANSNLLKNLLVIKELSSRLSSTASDDASRNLKLSTELIKSGVAEEMKKISSIIDEMQVIQHARNN